LELYEFHSAHVIDMSLTTAASFLICCIGPLEKSGNHCVLEGRPKTIHMTEVDEIPDSLPKTVVYTSPFRALPRNACVFFAFTPFLFLFDRFARERRFFKDHSPLQGATQGMHYIGAFHVSRSKLHSRDVASKYLPQV